MPVDIRSFFQKKAPASKKTSNDNQAKAASSTSTAAASKAKRKRQVAPENARIQEKQEENSKETSRNMNNQNEEAPRKTSPKKKSRHDHHTNDTKKESKSSPGKRKRIIVDSDDDDNDDDDEDFIELVDPPTISRRASPRRTVTKTAPKNDIADDEKVEISASAFFSKSSSPETKKEQSPSPAKKPKASKPPSSAKEEATPSPAKKLRTEPSPDDIKKTQAPSPTKTTTPAKSTPTSASNKKSSAKKASKKATTAEPKPMAPDNVPPLESLPIGQVAPECLSGYTFCVTAVDPQWSRDNATDFIKGVGGRVTTAVSGKTDYLFVMGPILEDDRPYTAGSKYKKAIELGTTIVVGRPALNGIVKYYSDLKGGVPAPPVPTTAPEPPKSSATAAVPNPYSRKPVVNPYARKAATTSSSSSAKPAANPYADKKSAVAAASSPAAKATVPTGVAAATMLWVDKYKPRSSRDILGNAESVRKLRTWLDRWESIFNKDAVVGKAYSNPNGPWKAVLLSGPPGIGSTWMERRTAEDCLEKIANEPNLCFSFVFICAETTTATLVAQESGRHVLEFNASDVRSKKSLKEDVGDITGSRTLRFGKQSAEPKKRVIIMDEVDGLGAGDRGGLAELIQMIKYSRVPIICICNDRQSQKIKSLVPYCMDLKYRRPVKTQIASRIMEVAQKEGFTVEQNAAETLAESCGNDVRQCLNACQMWASEIGGNARMSYTNLKEREKSINKDEMLRVSLFDATRIILQGRNGLHGATPEAERSHFLKRNDAFFVDYNFTGLMVQQNYLSVLKGPFSKAAVAKKNEEIEDVLERMSKAAESLSDFALAEHKLRSDQNWSVLPFVGSLTVKTGYHAGGESGGVLGGFPEFSAWLGKNSSKGKKTRMMQELQHHMNYKISGGSEDMRLSYLPVLRGKFLSLLTPRDGSGTEEAINLMDTYGLSRDDILERFDEFKMDSKDKGFSQLDSKQKTQFTKTYNAASHKSQALVVEQGGAKKPKRKASSLDELGDPDVVDDDKKIAGEEEEEEELDSEAIAKLFKKKGRRGAAKKGAAKKAAGAKKAAPKGKKK